MIRISQSEQTKQICVFISEDFDEKVFESKYNCVADLETGELYQELRFEVGKKFWKIGSINDVLYVYKDFQGLDFAGINWNVDAVEGYGFDWK